VYYIDKVGRLAGGIMGNGIWKTLIGLVLAAGLGAMACKDGLGTKSPPISNEDKILSFYSVNSNLSNYACYGSDIIYAESGYFIIDYNGAIHQSFDLASWSQVGNTGSAVTRNYFKYLNGRYFSLNSVNRLIYSTDLNIWTEMPGYNFIDIVYGKGVYIAYDYNLQNLYRSDDLVNWLPIDSMNLNIRYNNAYGKLAYNNGIFICLFRVNGYIWRIGYSTNGVNWAGVDDPTGSYGQLCDIAITTNNFFIIRSSTSATDDPAVKISSSSDGQKWASPVTVSSDAGFGYMASVAYGEGIIMILGRSRTNTPILFYSTNGTNFTRVNFDTLGLKVNYANGKIIIPYEVQSNACFKVYEGN
jgi:hypothetical protein